MEATLKFNLDNIDDVMAHKRCTKALDMALVLWEIEHNLYKTLKMNNEHADLQYEDGVYECIERIRDMMKEHGILIDDLTN
jgi:hypothetical protein